MCKQILFLIIVVAAIGFGVYQNYFSSRFKNSDIKGNETFDFIVVGSGSGGAAVASRLSENSKHSVLLLEAGTTDNILEVKLPAAFAKLYGTQVDWNYETEPQKNVNDRKMFWPRGKVIGGSSSMNAMMYARGHKLFYDDIGKQNKGWSYDEVVKYFKKLENNQRDGISEKHHGKEGPLIISDQVETHQITEKIFESMKNAGVHVTEDINGEDQEGTSKVQVHQKNGQRFSSADGYLNQKVLDRSNFYLQFDSLVTKVLFKGKTAIGVEYTQYGKTKKVFASKEVILSAGAVNTPQILLLSGVGPKEELEKLKIKVIHDLKGVGKNLQDHIFFTICHNATLPSVHTEENPGTIYKWASEGKGPLTSNLGEGASFHRTSKLKKDDYPNLEYVYGPLYFINHGKIAYPGDGTTIGPILLRPKSTGEIRLKSTNPNEKPIIEPNYLTHPDDLEALVEGFHQARKFYSTKPISDFVDHELHPGKHVQSDAQIKEFIKNSLMTIYHPTSTCKMGPSSDKSAVVDERLKVHGLKGIRIVDASIFPNVPTGHTHAPVVMVGEKGSDLIKEDWK